MKTVNKRNKRLKYMFSTRKPKKNFGAPKINNLRRSSFTKFLHFPFTQEQKHPQFAKTMEN